jgi:hypothetical protein
MWNIFINFPQFCHCCSAAISSSSAALFFLENSTQFCDIYIAISSNLWLKGILSWAKWERERWWWWQHNSSGEGNEFWWFSEMAKMCFHNHIFPLTPNLFFYIIKFLLEFMSMILKFSSFSIRVLMHACHASKCLFRNFSIITKAESV